MRLYHPLTSNFNFFFKRLNPSPSFQQRASSQYQTIKRLIENRRGLSGVLSPICFLQGSYKQATAIYTINDIDIVVLSKLWYPGYASGESWSRDIIFEIIAAPLKNDKRYGMKVNYKESSMCIKIDLGINVEILPVVFKKGNTDPLNEPFCLFRPENQKWEDGYARYHQYFLSIKNRQEHTAGNFIPAIKVLKHLRSQAQFNTVSFHIECLLYSLPDYLFLGGPADYIPSILNYITSISAADWYQKVLKTPCGERDIFVDSEWDWSSWLSFHNAVIYWSKLANYARNEKNKNFAINSWQLLLDKKFFPKFLI